MRRGAAGSVGAVSHFGRRTALGTGVAAVVGLALSFGSLGAQTSLADYDYENLSFRGFSLEVGGLVPSRVENTYSVGMRVDLGYLGPGFRIVPGISYWSSSLKDREVTKLEGKLDQLIRAELDPGVPFDGVNLGEIDWSDLALSLDGHFVWSIPLDLLSFMGGGVSAHVLNGEGRAISGTFIEDLLDRVAAGFNVHAGLEYPLTDALRLYTVGRYEFMEDLRYGEVRFGAQLMLTGPAAGEERR